jgi:preprotein translocase subunit SecD
VLDGLVISAPGTNERIPTGQAQITGGFTQSSATNLASQVKFGALPLSFTVQTDEKISATLGEEQLHRGLLAGLIGLALVVLYSLLQYRALGFVTVASLVVVGVITYGMILLLSWRQGYRLTLPGVAGLIVSIGVTADSFIVYFERIRDEVRDGKQLQPAVEAAWFRARRTILASDTVSFLAALVLFILAVGGVKGFAFTLGLTTLVDVAVVFLFTHPMMVLLSRTKFFGGGNKWSGFDAAHLGRDVSYAGRGRVRTPTATGGATIAERRARAAQEASGEPVQDDPPTPDESAPKDVPASSGGKR